MNELMNDEAVRKMLTNRITRDIGWLCPADLYIDHKRNAYTTIGYRVRRNIKEYGWQLQDLRRCVQIERLYASMLSDIADKALHELNEYEKEVHNEAQ